VDFARETPPSTPEYLAPGHQRRERIHQPVDRENEVHRPFDLDEDSCHMLQFEKARGHEVSGTYHELSNDQRETFSFSAALVFFKGAGGNCQKVFVGVGAHVLRKLLKNYFCERVVVQNYFLKALGLQQ